jgi:hypothetical protein
MCAHQVGKSPFKSLAEKVLEFQAKTPVRFKTKPTKPAPSKQQHAAITRAEVRTQQQMQQHGPASFARLHAPCCC